MINVLAQGHNAVTPLRLEPAALRSLVKHSTTEPLPSLHFECKKKKKHFECNFLNIFLYPSVLTCFCVLKKHLTETVLLSTHNICFGEEIRKLCFSYTPDIM